MRVAKYCGWAGALYLASFAAGALAGTCEDRDRRFLDESGHPKNVQAFLIGANACYGTTMDSDERVGEFSKVLTGNDPTNTRVQRAVRLLLTYAGDDNDVLPADLKIMAINELQKMLAAVESKASPGNAPVAVQDWRWSAASPPNVLQQLALDETLGKGCGAGQPQELCTEAVASVRAWLRVLGMARGALGLYSTQYLKATADLSALRLVMWHEYRDAALPQFFWEYYFNSRRMPVRKVVGGNPIGVEDIPTSQLIVMHPGASLEWRDSTKTTADPNSKPALYLEVLGTYKWAFDGATGKIRDGRGISLVASFANRSGRAKAGYGLMFHWQKSPGLAPFNVGITRAGNEMVYLVTMDLVSYNFLKEKLLYWKKVGSLN